MLLFVCAHALASALKKKISAGKGLPNGGIGHGVSPVTNGTHCSKSALNGTDAEENDGEVQHVNGHKTGDDAERLVFIWDVLGDRLPILLTNRLLPL